MQDHQTYVQNVVSGQFPDEIRVPLDPPFVDNRGEIQNLWLGNSGSITILTSKKGSRRAGHIHSTDWHSIYVISGLLSYVEGPDSKNLKEYIVEPGQMIFTRPDIYHEVIAIEDTVFLTVNGILKNHENYHKTMKKVNIHDSSTN